MSVFFVVIFLCLIIHLAYFDGVEGETFINSPYNTRQDTFSDRVVRGQILSREGEVLARTDVYEDGSEVRVYPYGRMFSHVVGFDSHGKSGLESEANFLLLTSHEFFIDQMKNELLHRKNMGDTVVSTLSSKMQYAAYDALGDRRGAVFAIEPSTGKILVEVSKPDFDPNTISQDWDYLVGDANNSSLLNRVINGAYPPGSTFKLVMALDYLRQKGTLNGYSYLCQGSVTREDYTLTCYNGNSHGQEDLYDAFARSCNCAFGEMGLNLGAGSIVRTAEDLLFNQPLPMEGARKSTLSLERKASDPLVMQTAIGQGDTLVSPAHMAMIVCAAANGGILMRPTLIDHVVSATGETVSTPKPQPYQRLMMENEANLLEKLMEGVVANGTATALNGRGYTAAGKTGSAEFDEKGSSHSWFVGYCNTDQPELVVAVLVENGGTGSESAVPVAARVFDSFYFD